jgi:hypothetical protein
MTLALCACSGAGGDGALTITSVAITDSEIRVTYTYAIETSHAAGPLSFDLSMAPSGMTVDAAGTIEWTPDYAALGTHAVEVRVSDGSIERTQSWTLRVGQGVLLGTALSWRGHTSSSTPQDFTDHVSGHAPWGRVIAFHTNWRDDGDHMGEVPDLALQAGDLAAQYGFVPALGIGWADGAGDPDLTSDSDAADDSWTNAETRAEYLQMITELAATLQPPFLFLGNETNVYFASHTQAEWDAWISQFEECYDAIEAVSPDTLVFASFQLEFMKGLGQKTGTSPPVTWDLIADHAASGKVDAIGFTSYPYLEYDAVADVPAGYYAEISSHWAGPVVFTEIAWPAVDHLPYLGSEAEQQAFLELFWNGTQDLDLHYVSWLFLHDWDGQASVPSVADTGLRDNLATVIRAVDSDWQAAAALREP